jgi:ribosomal-protein-alanine N-acetyltransferase
MGGIGWTSLARHISLDSGDGGVRGFAAMESDLEAKHVSLRTLTPADYEDYRNAVERNADHLSVAAADDAWFSMLQDADSFEAMWRLAEQARFLGTDFAFGIFENDDLIGEIGLQGVRRGAFESAFLSAWIDKHHLGKGRVEEAFVLMCRFAFETLGLNRIECGVLPENTAVQHALKKVGVESEGLAREYLMADGEFKDHLRYVFTASDWKRRRETLLDEWVSVDLHL